MDTKDAKGYQMVKEIIRVSSGRWWRIYRLCIPERRRDKTFPRSVPTVSTLNRFDWVVGTGNYTDYIDTAIAKQDKVFSSYAMQKAIALIAVCIVMLAVVAVLVFMIAQDITKSY